MKMKPKLAASISALMAGECAGIYKAISGVLPRSSGRPGSSSTKSYWAAEVGDGEARSFAGAASLNVRRSISVGNVPSTISLSQLVKAASVFGKVYTSSVRHLPDGLNCWDIQFESLKSCNRAIRAGALTVGSSRLSIQPPRASMVVTIRIEDISEDATFSEIHSICKSVGTTEGLAWVSKDGVDALFTVENDTESESILKKLNGTIVCGHCLSASLLPSNSSSASKSENEDARCKMALQIKKYLTELKSQLTEKKGDLEECMVLKVHMEDLQMLHEGIMHLEDLPSIIDTSDD
ncbi:uncharacterized protein LOC107840927 isoform X3 [Capsicum annuum]|uniref:uncharacterized protein LOC107840927 isoform X3 n=1 Tax=Capsicum annuum TaxID=4072 RepID=UPI001FB0E29D|nr:uncharacterized protein LOC107840927 isoform X3 [Capsicum annuum]